jgi:nucleotide-binding universal stress UspA family protein
MGLPKESILKVASDWNASMIVVGSHGRHGLDRFIMGSVSMAIMSHAHCSVTVVRLPRSERIDP